MKVELILRGENEYVINKDGKTQNTIQRHWRSRDDFETDHDFESRALEQYYLYIMDMKTFKPNTKVIRSTEL